MTSKSNTWNISIKMHQAKKPFETKSLQTGVLNDKQGQLCRYHTHKTRNYCFGSKQDNITLYQMKIGKYEYVATFFFHLCLSIFDEGLCYIVSFSNNYYGVCTSHNCRVVIVHCSKNSFKFQKYYKSKKINDMIFSKLSIFF